MKLKRSITPQKNTKPEKFTGANLEKPVKTNQLNSMMKSLSLNQLQSDTSELSTKITTKISKISKAEAKIKNIRFEFEGKLNLTKD